MTNELCVAIFVLIINSMVMTKVNIQAMVGVDYTKDLKIQVAYAMTSSVLKF